MLWLFAAVGSAVFAGITSILAKCGIRKTDSDVATALRTVVVLLFAWVMVFLTGAQKQLPAIDTRSLIFLILSGIATGASWLCYFRALSLGDVNRVVAIDKSSTVLSVLLAIVLFRETANLAVKLVGTALLGAGIFLMLERKAAAQSAPMRKWLPYAVLSAVFAALTSILANVGVKNVDSNLATALRTGVVLLMSFLIVFLKGKQGQLRTVDRREAAFIGLSGLATGASWLCYYYAIQNGAVSVVVPIDKMSILVTVVLSFVFFREKLGKRALLGLALMLCGTLAMAIWS